MNDRSANEFVDSEKFIRDERRNWQQKHLAAPAALPDFQNLSDEAFRALRREHYGPADLIAELRLRRILAVTPRKAAAD